MADVKARFSASLNAVGYNKTPVSLPTSSLERSHKLRQFVELVAERTKPGRHLSPEESKSYEGLKSAGQVLQGPALEQALKSLGQDKNQPGDVERQVSNMADKVSSLKTQLQTLNAIQKSLSGHYAGLLHQRDELTRQKADMLRQNQSSQRRAEEGDRQVDTALEDLMAAVRDLCAFHRRQGGTETDVPPRFLSEISQSEFHHAEGQYLSELTAYTKKQFFKGLADIAHSCAPGEEDTKFSRVDLDDSDQVILMGVTEEQHQKHRQELSRLQALYPQTEVEHINAQLAQRHAEAASNRTRRELEVLTQLRTIDDTDYEALSRHFVEGQKRIEDLRERVQELGRTQLTSLLQDMAALQVTRVLHGDYDLKIARQNYFTSKQDKVISDLQSQRSRHELLSMLYEVELRKHRDTHRLLSTADKQLTQLKEEDEKSGAAMQSPALLKVETPRMSIDSKDTFASRLCAMLGVKPSSGVPVLAHASLLKAAELLTRQIATLQNVLKANQEEMKQTVQNHESLCFDLERELFGCDVEGGQVPQPMLTVQDYSNLCSKLSTLVTSLEQNIKKLLKDYDGKKKLLQANPLLQTERQLFIYFFTQPDRLNQTLSDLARRVDSIALASK